MNEVEEVSPVAAQASFAHSLPPTEGLEPELSELVVTACPGPATPESISRLAADLGLSGVSGTDGLKAELQKIIFALHPDKSGGEFMSDRDKARFMKARALVELLDAGPQEEPGATPLPSAPRAISDARIIRRPAKTLHRLHMRTMADARQRIARHFSAPKIASAATGAAALLVTALSDLFEANPVLGPLLAEPAAVIVLLSLACAGAGASMAFWSLERSVEARAEHLMSEAALGDIFDQARLCADRHGRIGQLSAWDVRRAIEMLIHGRSRPARSRGRWTSLAALDLPILERIAAIQMQRLIERRVLRELDTPSIEILYEVSPAARQA